MTKEEFYLRCAEIMDVNHETLVRHPYFRRNRWNNREPGSGRFQGIGLVRYFGGPVHVAITHPIVATQGFDNPGDAIEWLSEIFART